MSKFSSPFMAKSPLNNGKKKYKKGEILDEGIPEIEASGAAAGVNIKSWRELVR